MIVVSCCCAVFVILVAVTVAVTVATKKTATTIHAMLGVQRFSRQHN